MSVTVWVTCANVTASVSDPEGKFYCASCTCFRAIRSQQTSTIGTGATPKQSGNADDARFQRYRVPLREESVAAIEQLQQEHDRSIKQLHKRYQVEMSDLRRTIRDLGRQLGREQDHPVSDLHDTPTTRENQYAFPSTMTSDFPPQRHSITHVHREQYIPQANRCQPLQIWTCGHRTVEITITRFMSIFDPNGHLNHYTFHLKILLQYIWRSGKNWDDSINEIHMKSWADCTHPRTSTHPSMLPQDDRFVWPNKHRTTYVRRWQRWGICRRLIHTNTTGIQGEHRPSWIKVPSSAVEVDNHTETRATSRANRCQIRWPPETVAKHQDRCLPLLDGLHYRYWLAPSNE